MMAGIETNVMKVLCCPYQHITSRSWNNRDWPVPSAMQENEAKTAWQISGCKIHRITIIAHINWSRTALKEPLANDTMNMTKTNQAIKTNGLKTVTSKCLKNGPKLRSCMPSEPATKHWNATNLDRRSTM